MNDFLIYSVQVILGSSIFYGFYKLFMERDTHFVLNRFYLLITLGLSILIPFIQIPFRHIPERETFKVVFQTIQVMGGNENQTGEFSLEYLLLFSYLIGVIFFLGRFILGVVQIRKITKDAQAYEKDGIPFRITPQQIAPFSFWRTIFIDERYKDSDKLQTILLHESIHIQQFHTIDVLLFEFSIIIFWFNPIFYFFRKSIKEQHEYIVDNVVTKRNTEIKPYLILLCNTAGMQFNIANNFNKPLIIKRMKKVAQTPSTSASMYKFLLVIPIILGLVVLFSIQNSNAKSIIIPSSNNSSILVSSDIVNDTIPKKPKMYNEVEKPATFPGGMDKLPVYLGQNIKYPKECRDKGITGIVLVQFKITSEGEIKNVKAVVKVDPLLDKEAVRVIKSMPKWVPAEDKGEKVDIIYQIPINFKLQ